MAFNFGEGGPRVFGAHNRPQIPQVLLQRKSENKDIKSYVIAAVLTDPRNFEHCSQRLKGDKDVILAALRSDVNVFSVSVLHQIIDLLYKVF
jgi:hypothetical protein